MSELAWWQRGVIYQVYPRSFQDTNGDGVGDLPGIARRLNYLQALGIDAVWISPFYPSPMADFGYDVADYIGVDPLFGTLADFDALLTAVHARGMRLILDFVPNHTSDEHPWFIESRSSRTSPKRNWYLWRDPGPEDAPPNNWMSNFGGPAWTFDKPTGQWYCHSFLPQQPDLNWHNPAVRAAVYAAMRFWLARGVDGFRMDVLWLLIKDAQFRDNLPNPDFQGGSSFWSVLPTWTANQPETHTIVREMRALMDGFGDRVLIGEIYLPVEQLVTYYGAHGDEAHLPFNFHLIQTAWQADAIAALILRYEAALPTGAWPNWVLGNHDQHRLATRIGPAQARVAAVLLLTLRGTPTVYYGDELGMPDAKVTARQVKDPAELRQPGQGFGRDPERSPMLWERAENAGFCEQSATPWLPLVDSWQTLTVAAEEADRHSMHALYRALLALRRSTPALTAGAIEQVETGAGVLSYTRVQGEVNFRVLLNLTDTPQTVSCPAGSLCLTTSDEAPVWQSGQLALRADEAVVWLIEQPRE